LRTALPELMLAAERTLQLDAAQRGRTILRMDAGAGSVEDINWALGRGYQVHAKDYSGQRARILADSVTEWVDDPQVPGRQVGWVQIEADMYVRPVRRLAVRCRKRNGQWGIGVIVSALAPKDVLVLTGQPPELPSDDHVTLLAYAHFYDQRGGGVETAIKNDKQGLGITKRNKKRFEAQQMMAQLNALAHNLIVWSRRWLAQAWDKVANLGILRMVRDVFHLPGLVHFRCDGSIERIALQRADPFAPGLCAGLLPLLATLHRCR